MTKELKEEFESFLKEFKAKSEFCQYLALFQDVIGTVKNLVVADRDRNWDLNVDAARFVPVFRGFDAITYLQYASFYLHFIQYASCMRDLFRTFLLCNILTSH